MAARSKKLFLDLLGGVLLLGNGLSNFIYFIPSLIVRFALDGPELSLLHTSLIPAVALSQGGPSSGCASLFGLQAALLEVPCAPRIRLALSGAMWTAAFAAVGWVAVPGAAVHAAAFALARRPEGRRTFGLADAYLLSQAAGAAVGGALSATGPPTRFEAVLKATCLSLTVLGLFHGAALLRPPTKRRAIRFAGWVWAVGVWFVPIRPRAAFWDSPAPVASAFGVAFERSSGPVVAVCLVGLVGGLYIIHRLQRLAIIPVLSLRKLFHVLGVMLFLGPLWAGKEELLAVGVCVCATLFVALEVLRVEGVLPSLQRRIQPFLDEREDSGLVLTHIHLLLGLGCPIVLELATARFDPFTASRGLSVVGVGDSLAAIVGSNLGSHYFMGGPKSVEGSAAFAAGVIVTDLLLLATFRQTVHARRMAAVVVSAVVCAGQEAAIGDVDNLSVSLTALVIDRCMRRPS